MSKSSLVSSPPRRHFISCTGSCCQQQKLQKKTEQATTTIRRIRQLWSRDCGRDFMTRFGGVGGERTKRGSRKCVLVSASYGQLLELLCFPTLCRGREKQNCSVFFCFFVSPFVLFPEICCRRLF